MAPAPKYSPQEQEDIILNAAVDCINESSLLDFTMSSISKAAGLSMGSIYKHVQCKEDIIFALATKVFRHNSNNFKKVLKLPLTTPEKLVAISLLSPEKNALFPFDSHLESFAANEVVIASASPLWTERMIKAHEECEKVFNECMTHAAQSGEIILGNNPEQLIEEINLGGWALYSGYQYVARVVQIRNISEGTDSLNEPLALDSTPIRSVQRFLNAYQWKTPLDAEGIAKAAELLTEQNLR